MMVALTVNYTDINDKIKHGLYNRKYLFMEDKKIKQKQKLFPISQAVA